jgi:hypothetical protein
MVQVVGDKKVSTDESRSKIRMKGRPRRQVMMKRSVTVEGKMTWLTNGNTDRVLEDRHVEGGREEKS